MTVGESLRRFRKSLNLSQGEVANTLGMMQQSYYRFESGRSTPRADDIIKLADAYDVSADYLLGRSDEPRLLRINPRTLDLVRSLEAWKNDGQAAAQ